MSSIQEHQQTVLAIDIQPHMVVRLSNLQAGYQIVNGKLVTLYQALFGNFNTAPQASDGLFTHISVRHVVINSGVNLAGVELVAVFYDDKLLEYAVFLLPEETLERIKEEEPDSRRKTKRNRNLSPGQQFSKRRN